MKLITSWIIGVVVIFSGLSILFTEDPLIGILLVGMGIVPLPPFDKLFKKFDVNLSWKSKTIVMVILFLAILVAAQYTGFVDKHKTVPQVKQSKVVNSIPQQIPSSKITHISPSPKQETKPPESVLTSPTHKTPTSKPGIYHLSVQPTVLNNNAVRLDITSNIPGTIEIMATVSLVNSPDNELSISDDAKVIIKEGKGSIVIGKPTFGEGGAEKFMVIANYKLPYLPTGQYRGEVSFYPAWGFKDKISEATGITKEISAESKPFTLNHGSMSAIRFLKIIKGRQWVADNLSMGTKWDMNQVVAKFGKPQQVQMSSGNPKILTAYYFPSIEMTIIVNTYKGEVSVWREGKATK